MRDDQDKALQAMLKEHGVVGVCTYIAKWWDEYSEEDHRHYVKVAKAMADVLEEAMKKDGL